MTVWYEKLGYPSWNPAILIKKPQSGIAEIGKIHSFVKASLAKPPIYFHAMILDGIV